MAKPPKATADQVTAANSGADQATSTAANAALDGMFRPIARVKGPAKGRWRAGIHFGPEERVLAEGDITEDQLHAILADPELTVVLDAALGA